MTHYIAALVTFTLSCLVVRPSAAATAVGRCPLGPAPSVVNVSCIAMGTLHLHEAGTPAAALAIIKQAVALGLTTWDTSDVYNSMPQLLGAALQLEPGLRSQVEIIGKMDIIGALNGFGFDSGSAYDTSAAHLNAVLQTYLTALNTTYIDVVILHRMDYLTDVNEVADTVAAWVAAGKVKAFGTSNYDKDTFTALAGALRGRGLPLVANEIEISVLTPTAIIDGTVSFHYALGTSLLAWGPVGGDPWGSANRLFGVGSLDGTQHNQRLRTGLGTVATALGSTPDVVAIAWLMRHPARIIPIIGTMDISAGGHMQTQAGAGAVAAAMTRQQWYHIADAAGIPLY